MRNHTVSCDICKKDITVGDKDGARRKASAIGIDIYQPGREGSADLCVACWRKLPAALRSTVKNVRRRRHVRIRRRRKP